MEVWIAEDEVQNAVKELIANHHTDLVDVEDGIVVLMREKAASAGDGVYLGKSKKAPPLMSVKGIATKDWKFFIEIADDEWSDLNNKQRLALLDHHLCACRVEKDSTSGEVKRCYIQPPDVSFYRDEVERHGFWRQGSGKTPEPDLIRDLFGDE